jgi:signal transduction histidine kinase
MIDRMPRWVLCLTAAACAGPTIAVLRTEGELSLAGPSAAAQVLVVVAGLALIATLDVRLAAAGAAWLAAEWASPAAPNALIFSAGILTTGLALPLIVWRAPAAAALAGAGALLLGPLGEDPGSACTQCPEDLWPALGLQEMGAWLQIAGAVAAIAWVAVATVRGTPAARRRALPTALPAAAFAAATALGLAIGLRDGLAAPGVRTAHLLAAGALVALAVGTRVKPLRLRRARRAVTRATTAVAEADSAALSGILAPIVGDPAPQLLYAVPGLGWTDAAGHPAELPDHGMLIEEDGAAIAALVHAGRPDKDELDAALAAGRLRLDAERLRAAVLARVQALRLARLQVVDASDQERRRLEHDLHDGAQQRLVALRFALGLVRARATSGELTAQVERADAALEQALAELRELAHGLYPASLDSDGLPTALQALAERYRAALTIGPLPDRRFPREVERVAYRAVAEALASAEPPAAIGATARNETLHLRIDHGGAPDSDRIHALGGRLRLTAEGVEVQLPCA